MRQPWRAFDPAWFARWQVVLLALLAEPLLGRWLRWVLCIRPHDIGYRGRIVQLLPHAYVVVNADGTLTADFRTHPKYAKRMYYAFRPVWWTLHAWDWAVADRWLPALSAGFNTLGPVYPDPDPGSVTCDGWVNRFIANDTLANLRGGSVGSADWKSNDTSQFCARLGASSTTNQFADIYRGIFGFDTSPLGASASVTAATFSVYGQNIDSGIGAPDLHSCAVTPASNTGFGSSDFNQFGSTSFGSVANASFTTAGYNDVTQNGSGISNVSLTGVTHVGTRTDWDLNNSFTGTWSSGMDSGFSVFFADQTGNANDPKLVVTYAPPARFILHS